MGRAELRSRHKVLSFVRIYSAEIELAVEHFPHHMSIEVVGLAWLYLQLVQRNETPRAYADDRTEVVLTRIDRGREIGSTLQGTKPLPVSADPSATARICLHDIN